MKKIRLITLLLPVIFYLSLPAGLARTAIVSTEDRTNIKPILPGAYQLEEYLPLLKNKRIGVFANQTSIIGNTHLIDTLVSLGVNVQKIFSPEHGFRGTADAGQKVNGNGDHSKIPIVSLYGKKLKPSAEDLQDIDILIFDIQDVGVRFYTYISSLEYFLESAVENGKPLIVLDRPNPNGFYVDGPVLQPQFKSFVGMQPIPVVYGLTIGEYAGLLLGENKIDQKEKGKDFSLHIIRCKNYTHADKYILPVAPSPNLKEMGSIYLYPSTCLFEGTVLSEGRGTDHPFEIFGHPDLPATLFKFIPRSMVGAMDPKWKDKICYGWNLFETNENHPQSQIQLKWILEAYKLFPDKPGFFLKPQKTNTASNDFFFNKLAGNNLLMQQIKAGKSESEIRKSWENELNDFKLVRKKYLLYEDF